MNTTIEEFIDFNASSQETKINRSEINKIPIKSNLKLKKSKILKLIFLDENLSKSPILSRKK